MTNLAGNWITGFTRVFGPAGESHYDYSSVYILQFFAALVALVITEFFRREERRGRVVPLGLREFEQETAGGAR
jgi:hypothetical protein